MLSISVVIRQHSTLIGLIVFAVAIIIPRQCDAISQLCPCTFPPYHNLNKPQPRQYDEKAHLLPSSSIHICVHEKHKHKLLGYIGEIGGEDNTKGDKINHSSGSSRNEDHFVFYKDDVTFHDKINKHKCHVMLTMTTDSTTVATAESRRMCPQGCDVDIPTLTLPYFVLEIDPSMPLETLPRYAVTCSLTLHEHIIPKWQLISSIDKQSHILHSFPRFVIHEAISRQYYECLETAALIKYASPSYSHLVPNTTTPNEVEVAGSTVAVSGGGGIKRSKALRAKVNKLVRRKVQAIIIWIGTIDRLSMAHDQANALYASLHEASKPGKTTGLRYNAASSFHEERAIIPWIATELIYPCHPDKITCKAGMMKRYAGLLPGSAVNYMPPGWGCAQRRPLRSLAHALLFFDPDFMIILDDDTYFNYPLFAKSSYFDFVMQNMTQEPIYLGEALGRTGENGHLSKIGFFIGGSGYILGKKVLERMVSREIVVFGNEHVPVHRERYYIEEEVQTSANPNEFLKEDRFRSKKHIERLSVLQEALEYSAWHCPKVNVSTILPGYKYEDYLYKSILFHWDRETDIGHRINTDACLLYHPALRQAFDHLHKTVPTVPQPDFDVDASPPHQPLPVTQAYTLPFDSTTRVLKTIPMAVRLVDMCTNLMANEHTCQHSDHSMGRCFIYGAGATPLMTACENQVSKGIGQGQQMDTDKVKLGSDDLLFGMCFTAPECDIDEHITCHRYSANETNLKPMRTSTSKGYYKKFSSFYDGKIVDTQM